MVGPRKALFMDEISTGLDSSTTYQITKCLGNFVHLMDATVLIALLQPAPETFDLFDDLILLSEGYIVYHGPRAEVLEFFESIGFRLPPRKGVADFLQEVILMQCDVQTIFIFHVILHMLFFSIFPIRLHQKMIKLNIGLIHQSHMHTFPLRKLLKRLRSLGSGGR